MPPERISFGSLVEMEVFVRINFTKQGKLLSMIPQIKIDLLYLLATSHSNIFKSTYTKFEIIKFRKVRKPLLKVPGALLN